VGAGDTVGRGSVGVVVGDFVVLVVGGIVGSSVGKSSRSAKAMGLSVGLGDLVGLSVCEMVGDFVVAEVG